jgi:hypothetical protein
MALLAIRQVGFCCRAVVGRLSPVGRMPHHTVTEGAIETAGATCSVCGDDRSSQVGSMRVAECTGRGVQPGRIVNGIGVGRRRVRSPGNRRMGRPHGYAICHVAGSGGPARGKTAHTGNAAGEVGAMTGLTTGETAV